MNLPIPTLPTLRVVTFNVALIPTDPDSSIRKPHFLPTMQKFYQDGYDVVLLQEVFDEQLVEQIPAHHFHSVYSWETTGNRLHNGLVTLLRTNTLQPTSSQLIRFPQLNLIQDPLERNALCVWASFRYEHSNSTDNKNIQIINCHLSPTFGEGRRSVPINHDHTYRMAQQERVQQLQTITHNLTPPYLIGGDMNINASDDRKEWESVPWYRSEALVPTYRGDSQYQPERLDYLFASQPISQQVMSIDWSDHYPVKGSVYFE